MDKAGSPAIVISNDLEEITQAPSPLRVALTKTSEVRDELARVYRAARSGKIETSEATRLTYILVSLSKIIESSDIESRLDALEGEIGKGKKHGKK